MSNRYLRKYGVEATLPISLFEVDGVDFRVDAVHAAGDTTITKNEGTEASTTNGFTDEETGYSIVLSATEMTAARIHVFIVDQGTKVWLDTDFVIETYGNASAQHEMDFDEPIGTATDLSSAVFDYVLENSKSFAEVMRIMKAAVAGITTDSGTKFRDDADSKDRIEATIDASNNRTAVTLDGS